MDESAKRNLALIGERMKVFRESLGLGQEQLAAQIGGSKRGIQDNEWGKAAPNSKILVGLAKLGLNVNWLLLGEGEMLMKNVSTSVTPSDIKLYGDAMEAIDYLLQQGNKAASYQQRRALVDALYQASKQAGEVDKTMAVMLAKIAA